MYLEIYRVSPCALVCLCVDVCAWVMSESTFVLFVCARPSCLLSCCNVDLLWKITKTGFVFNCVKFMVAI